MSAITPQWEASVRALVTVKLTSGELTMVAVPAISIPPEDYRNERVVAKALRKIAREIETGTSFYGIRVMDAAEVEYVLSSAEKELRDGLRKVADYHGMAFQDSPWWPEACALGRAMAVLPKGGEE